MLVSFIGSPCSGKTTTAAEVFASLKEQGTPCEFIPEQARMYIAELRFEKNLQPRDPLTLLDVDQIQILRRQIRAEEVMVKSLPKDHVIVTDSSPLNTWLYLSPEARVRARDRFQEALKHADLIFYTPPVRAPLGLDPNRVHSMEQSRAIDAQIPELVRAFNVTAIPLVGDVKSRAGIVFSHLWEKLT